MSDCNCSEPTQATPVTESKDYVALKDLCAEEQECSSYPQATPIVDNCPETNSSTTSGASASQFLDARGATEMTLIGRVGKCIAKFVGNGVIQIKNGKAYLVDSLPMKITHLYHKYALGPGDVSAVVGDPKPYRQKVIADAEGATFGVRGLTNEDSMEVWDSANKQFEQRPISALPIQAKGELPKKLKIELSGFEPNGACGDTTRPLVGLAGSGLLSVTQDLSQGCPDSTCPEESAPSFAQLTPFPGDGSYYVRVVDGAITYEPRENIQDGEDGTDGVDGTDGEDGKSTYQLWLDAGNVGTEEDFLNSLVGPAGAAGADGADGVDGQDGQNFSGDLVTTSDTVEKSFLFFAPIQPLTNGNQDAALPLNSSTRADTGWSGSPGTGNFTYSDQADYVQVTVSALLKIADASTPAAADVSPTIELLRNGVVVASAVAEQSQLNDNTESTANLTYLDATPNASSVYEVRTRQESSVAESVPIQSGFVSAVAIKQQTVITSAVLQA